MTTIVDAHAGPAVGVHEPEAGKPLRRRAGLVRFMTLASLLAAAAAIGIWLWSADSSTKSSPDAAGPTATARVERGTMSATESWDGILGYGSSLTVVSTTAGTVTRLVDQGTAVERGSELYRVDERPVILLYGAVPMYRDLASGTSGADVEQLEANLAGLGYAGVAVDDAYDELTAEAVRSWQGDIGAEQTGTVARGDVAFVPGTGRVEALRIDVGDVVAPGRPVLDVSGNDQVVSLEVALDDGRRLDVGTEVTVVLPGGAEMPGTVGASTVVEIAAEPAGGGNQTDAARVMQVQIALSDDVDDELIGAGVEVVVAIDERTDVLFVPVTALLALAEGGYGLEVVRDDGATEIFTVDTGLFAGGKVQVEGEGISEGTEVGIAGR